MWSMSARPERNTVMCMNAKSPDAVDTLKGIRFGRRGQKLDLYFPPNVSRLNDGPPPLVVFIYGGAWGSGERSIYCLLARQMSEELGAAVICPDYCTYPQVRASRQPRNNQQGCLESEVQIPPAGGRGTVN